MKIDSIKFKGHRCFRNDWVGFDVVKPINVIIGRNNSGKSHLLDLVRKCCCWDLSFEGTKFKCSGILCEKGLKQQFSPNTSGGHLGGNHWQHGQRLVGQEVNWELVGKDQISNLKSVRSDYLDPDNHSEPYASYSAKVGKVVSRARHELDGSAYRHLLADRDLKSEAATEAMGLSNSGDGATNIIRRYLTSSDPKYPRDLITGEFLTGLNYIFGNDGDFTEINVQFHDYEGVEQRNVWEIYLGEERKGIVPLSKSGSGLKTVILVLLNLIVMPKVEKRDRSDYVFTFEELENNLHPALLRRLFQYIETYAKKHGASFFLTTHSSVALDLFGLSDQAQTIHVKHDGQSASVSVVAAHIDKLGVIGELGAKPSDLLQANGIIWVEGPSDRIYINHWIELISDGAFKEGRDYQCAFYGGALLARTSALSPEEEQAEQNRVNLLRVNPNIYVVCDGDRDGPRKPLKDRVERMQEEVNKIPGSGFWATQGREIENYVPGAIISQVRDTPNLPDPEQCEQFFGSKTSRKSYLQDHQNIKTLDKTEFAASVVKHMTINNMKDRFDWKEKVTEIVDAIRQWNA